MHRNIFSFSAALNSKKKKSGKIFENKIGNLEFEI